MSGPEDPNAWIAKADEDLLVIDAILDVDQIPWSAVCFHAQQAAEKMQKAYVVACGRVPPKTHDLVTLLRLCRDLSAPLHGLDEDCKFLLRHGAAARYPGEHLTPTEQQGREAFAASKRVYEKMLPLIRKLTGA